MEKPRRKKGLYETSPRVALILFGIAVAILIGMLVLAQMTQGTGDDTSQRAAASSHHMAGADALTGVG